MAHLVRIQLRNVSEVSARPGMGRSLCTSWGAGSHGLLARRALQELEGSRLGPATALSGRKLGLGDGRFNPPGLPPVHEVCALVPQQASSAREEKSSGSHPSGGLLPPRF